MKKSRGILPIFIALIVVGSLGVVGGGYTGARYYQSTKYAEKAEQSFYGGNYPEALDYYNKSLSFWKKKKVEEKKVIVERENGFLVSLNEGTNASGQNKWQECVDKLKNISSDSKSYSLAQNLTHECQVKVDEETARKKAEEEATTATAPSKPTASATRRTTSSGQSASTSSSSGTAPVGNQSSSSASGNSVSCISNTNPVFTHHITDVSKINEVIIPPRIIYGDLKTHSYLGTHTQRVPIYAPAAMTLYGGVQLEHGDAPNDFGMDFKVSCEIMVRIGHITEPVQSIRDTFPVAQENSHTNYNITPIKFAAGELIGYTTRAENGNWDFGVYNSSTTNRYASDPTWNHSKIYTTAVCPYDFFSPSLKSAYTSKYVQDFGNSTHDGIFFCN